jgi:aspartate/methionine/tyrosine aminotransferase
LVVPPGWSGVAERLAQNLFLAPPTLGQHVALAAFEPTVQSLLAGRCAILRQRRDLLLDALLTLGLTVPAIPQGAFYAFTGLPPGFEDASAFAAALLEAAGVAVTPGADFGGADAARMLRFAYTEDEPRLREGLRRLQGFLSPQASISRSEVAGK